MPYRPGDKTVTFEGRIEVTTAKAYLVVPTIGPDEVWVPKSQVVTKGDPDDDGLILWEVTEWWASKNEMS
jgi:hypothetical protein